MPDGGCGTHLCNTVSRREFLPPRGPVRDGVRGAGLRPVCHRRHAARVWHAAGLRALGLRRRRPVLALRRRCGAGKGVVAQQQQREEEEVR